MRKKILAMMMVGMLSAFTLAGCGSDDASSTKTETASKTSEETSTEETSSEETSSEEATSEEDTEEAEDSSSSEEGSVWDNFDEFYAGVTDDENTYMLLAFGQDGALGCVMFIDVESKESGSWVGDVTIDEETGVLSISDESNGTALGFTVEEYKDGYLLDMGDVGQAAVGAVEQSKFEEAANAIDEGSAPQF